MELTLPEPSATDLRDILNRCLRGLLDETPALLRRVTPARRADAATFLSLMRRAMRVDPGALIAAFRRPSIAAPLRCMRDAEPARADDLFDVAFASLTFDLALGGALERPVVVAHPPPRILSFTHLAGLTTKAGPLALDTSTKADEDAIAIALGDGVVLALADDNPVASVEAHPEKAGNALDLGEASPAEWASAFTDALALIERHLPALRAEMSLLAARIVPVGVSAERHLSASYRDAIGTIYASLHPDPLTLAEALLHETAHNKLNALFEIDPVLENPPDELYDSPIRPDARPLRGVLLALHAFLPVARLYELLLASEVAERPRLQARFDEILEINAAAAGVLFASARPSELGGELLADLARWDAHFRKTT